MLDEKNRLIIKYLGDGLTVTEISDLLHITKQAVSQRIKNMKKKGIEIPIKERKIVEPKLKKEPDEIDKDIIESIKNGEMHKEIAKKYGVTRSAISTRVSRMKDMGIKVPEPSRIRKKEPDQIDLKIIKLMNEGSNQTEIAEVFNVNHTAILKRINKMKEMGIEIPDYKSIRKQKINKQKYIEELLRLKDTKNASPEQIATIASLYGIDLNKELGLQKDENQNEILDK